MIGGVKIVSGMVIQAFVKFFIPPCKIININKVINHLRKTTNKEITPTHND
jgi:hypothetical protein